MKVYVVSADTWGGGYGSEISLFGIFRNRIKAENRKKKLKEQLGYVAQFNEVWLDGDCGIYLGGYTE